MMPLARELRPAGAQRSPTVIICTALWCLVPGCGSSSSGEEVTPLGDSGAESSVGCPSGEGPPMVRLSSFCIDSTEVTARQYDRFVQTVPKVEEQVDVCKWNSTFAPDQGGWCRHGTNDPEQYPDRPVVCIDWCDAYAYCHWAGKRLCGRIGGGPASYDNPGDPAVSEWMFACSSGGANVYPYGTTYDASACNTVDVSKCANGYDGICDPVNVGTMSSCQSSESGFGGVFDLCGNVVEWEDACSGSTGASDYCRFRGGALVTDQYKSKCAPIGISDSSGAREDVGEALGFRCCANTQ